MTTFLVIIESRGDSLLAGKFASLPLARYFAERVRLSDGETVRIEILRP